MHWRKFTFSLLLTGFLIFFLDRRWGTLPPMGRLLSPQEGFWRNAEPVDKDFSGSRRLAALQGTASVWLDERLVPHIFAANTHDLYYLQGYVTARFRLWQMEMQVRAAAGRVSEVLGEDGIPFDRLQRRKGMVSAARLSLEAMEADSATHQVLEAYTAGINAYISSLRPRDLPLEYKLLDYRPEPWTPLKSALLLKFMSDDLTGHTDDLENTNFLALGLQDPRYSLQHFDQLFPSIPDSSYPIVPEGSPFYRPSRSLPSLPDSTWLKAVRAVQAAPPYRPDPDNGSNNWVVAGKKTASGAPILANDPHLGLNLPSLWFEVQLQGPGMNVYGASLPGAPGVIIGFNDHIAWGVTNAQRDVKDYYAIRFRDASRRQYWFEGAWTNTAFHVERIAVRGHDTVMDSVAYTVFGPVIYDHSFPDTSSERPYLAVHWAAAAPSNELKTFYLLNHAQGYNDYLDALQYYQCPAQNFAYADKGGNIALWQQGRFPLRPRHGGRFVLPGEDSGFLWKDYIPFRENPHAMDPEQGFLFSANQNPTDSSYPYPYFGSFIQFRAKRIHEVLQGGSRMTIQDMMDLQTDLRDDFAAEALPFMLRALDSAALQPALRRYRDTLVRWDYRTLAGSTAPTLFHAWWDSLYAAIWDDDLTHPAGLPMPKPTDNTTIEWLLRGAMPYVDDRRTPAREDVAELVQRSFLQAMQALAPADSGRQLQWGQYRGTDLMHLTKIPAFSHQHLFTGGDAYTVNALKKDHGPSWRMIVQLGDSTVAYGVYPGGQSGNPGSRYYDNFIGHWLQGRYYRLHVFAPGDSSDRHVRYRIHYRP